MRKIMGIGAMIILILLAVWFFLAGFKTVNNKAKGIDALYDFRPVQKMDLSEKVEDSGTVVLSKNMDIYPAYEVTVKRIYVKTGDQVQKGQLLMELESPAMKTQWADANSSYRQALLNLTLAQKELARTKTLFEAQGATIDELDTAQNKTDIAREQLQNAQAKLEQVTRFPDEANFMAADHYTLLIKAPFTGSVAWISSRPGDKVQSQAVQNANTAQNVAPLISLIQKDSLQVEIVVDQSEIAKIKLGQRVIITASDEHQTKLNGVVYGVGLVGTNTAGVITYPVRVLVDKDVDQVLKNGMTVDGTIMTSEYPDVLVVPAGAIVERRGHAMVGVRQGDKVVFARVETGITSNAFTEITSGLAEGDMVAVPKPVVPNNNNDNNNQRQGGGDRGPMSFH